MADEALHRAIGQLEGQISAMQQQLAALAPQIQVSRQESSDGRSRIYKELEALRAEHSTSKANIERLADDLAEAKPVMHEIKRWKERFIGMQMLLGAGAAAIGGAVVLFWKWIAMKIGLG
ncbi:DUF1515 family protein [Rhizobium sp. RU36D]|uniref:DUF1515 family protein n=1 Tax=Rhizobium sp. RU36D TaxID=1907415 RepID=UPI0009D81CB2|nr:DUF1515 family protein [Rhizobium sp. RU36D]SMC95938.1 Protein of unknown function [Rhizobium sp. RU36D]